MGECIALHGLVDQKAFNTRCGISPPAITHHYLDGFINFEKFNRLLDELAAVIT